MSTYNSLITQHFAFASGRTGVLQQLLMSQSDVDRLLGSHSLTEAQKILTELKLTSTIDQGISEWRGILEAVGSWVRSEVEQMSPITKRPVFHILWLQNDAPLLSFLLKQHHGLTSAISKEPLSSMTAYGAEALSALISEGNTGSLPSHLVEFVASIKRIEKPSPQEIDAAVANFIAETQLRLARASGSADILRFTKHLIDLTNIRTALRGSSDFIECGSFALTAEKAAVIKAIERSDLPITLAEALREEDENTHEQAMSAVLAEDITHMWNVPLSIEPLFAFAAIGMAQIKLLRVLMIGKSNELSPQEIKQVLPPFLSASHYLLS